MKTNRSKYKHYPSYKPSGVEWLGEIPEHWEVRKLKWILQESLKYGANESGELGNDNQPRYIRITDFNDGGELVNDNVKTLPYELAKDFLLKDGDILFARSGATVGKTFQFKNYNGLACFAGYLIKATPDEKIIDSDFLYYFTKSRVYIEWKNLIFIQSTIQNIGADKYKVLPITLPPLPEQRAIANFLGRETAKIDVLVEKEGKMIELLKEKRSALITKAVTKGLDPNVKLKPSGVEWIGEIPEYWDARKIKFNAHKIGSGKTPLGGANAYVDEGILFIRSQNVQYNRLELEDSVFIDGKTDAELFSSRLLKHDVLLNITGASIGRTCIYNSNQRANVNQHVCIIRVNESRLLPNFLVYFIISATCQNYILNTQNGSSREALTFNQIGNLFTPFPSLSEQKIIASFLDRETTKIDKLIEKIGHQIELLKEYRQSLITSAVTGKIDVSTMLNTSVREEVSPP
ncbi:MAG: restriction endonuclease subunit S [Candidatus Brocadiaceae bacterium]|nr:restriction endonuclease subunit S [Candidatus Brocadiaceae bacterium]